MGVRYYDSALGRFISRDPLGYLGSPINLYTYCADNPVKYTDPSGEFVWIPIIGTFIIGSLIVGAFSGCGHTGEVVVPAVDTGGGGSVLGSAEALAKSHMLAKVEAARMCGSIIGVYTVSASARTQAAAAEYHRLQNELDDEINRKSVQDGKVALKAISHRPRKRPKATPPATEEPWKIETRRPTRPPGGHARPYKPGW